MNCILTAAAPIARMFPKVHHGQDAHGVVANDAIDQGERKPPEEGASALPNHGPDIWKLTDQSHDALNFI